MYYYAFCVWTMNAITKAVSHIKKQETKPSKPYFQFFKISDKMLPDNS